ncbi:hypothetical protein [Nocardia gipuzkoensis]|uniref:hypothetical protein n=1 Tax=Nocardia gipuzkoensis TaxID=2749991 RepID=UPI0015EFBC32|nr:hypothetical protein [Nocardia gipuzkoensis]
MFRTRRAIVGVLVSVAAASVGTALSAGVGTAAPVLSSSSAVVHDVRAEKKDPGDHALRIFNSEQECRAHETPDTICIPYRAGTWALLKKGLI